MVVAPVFVIVVPASTPYVVVVPWRTDGSAARIDTGMTSATTAVLSEAKTLIATIFAFRLGALVLIT